MSEPAVEAPIEEPTPPDAAAEAAVERRPVKTLGDVIAASPTLAAIMARVEADVAAGRLAPIEVEEDDPAVVRRAVLAERVARWREGWANHLPRRYEGASLGSLKDGQDPQGKVTGWLDSRHLGLGLVGPAGRGKTYCLAALGYSALDHQVKPLLITMADLNDAMRPGGDATVYAKATTADVLLLDDIGRERITEWTLEQTQRLLDARSRQALRTAWSTNLSAADLADRYGEPIMQRLMDDTVVANFSGVTEIMRPTASW
jgi:DNA replication protein DnaC